MQSKTLRIDILCTLLFLSIFSSHLDTNPLSLALSLLDTLHNISLFFCVRARVCVCVQPDELSVMRIKLNSKHI